MDGLLTRIDAEMLFFNSFDFSNNLHQVKLLYIEVDNESELKKRIVKVKSFYDNQNKYQIEKSIEDYNSSIDGLTK